MSYNWNFTYVGGVPRVQIATGEDIAHLEELNEKMWTVLSCPVKGLEIDEKSLDYIDTNKDGFVHVTEVVATAKWLCSVLKDPNLLLKGTDTVPLNALNTECEDAAKLLEAAKKVLEGVGKADATEISLADSSSCLETVLAKKLEALKAERAAQAEVVAPYADQTDAVAEAYAALDAKVKDFFLRSRLAQFADKAAVLDVQEELVQGISAANLTEKTADIAAYPLFRIDGTDVIALDATPNPAWAAQWAVVKPLFTDAVTEAAWNEVGAKLAAFADYKASLEVAESDIELDEETANIQTVDKLLHLTRDFFTLLKNFVTLSDFYNPAVKAIFQAGTLYIDQRACDLCLRVNDAGAMAAQAAASNLFLVFCHCTNKVLGQEMDIVAAVTVGDVSNIAVGKNCIFYDRQGNDWDARVTNVMDNPISIKQAAWSPYKKMAAFVEEKIRKMAQSKEESVISNATASIDAKTDSAASAVAAAPAQQPTEYKEAAKAAGKAFDVAKFAGIFAAIGMAVGFIGSFLATVIGVFAGLAWWQMILSILAIFLLISGPSMFLAWTKLRKRNLAPVLNANGWAVNAAAMISIAFGNAMTEQAKFPFSAKMRNADPFADKGTPLWKKCIGYLIALLVILGVLWYFNAFAGVECLSFLPDSPYDPAALTAAPDSTAVK